MWSSSSSFLKKTSCSAKNVNSYLVNVRHKKSIPQHPLVFAQFTSKVPLVNISMPGITGASNSSLCSLAQKYLASKVFIFSAIGFSLGGLGFGASHSSPRPSANRSVCHPSQCNRAHVVKVSFTVHR